ncbi:MAG: 2-oxo acid dehydrogenase subunit E2 [Actinobacteria bacterium]|nr:2-oxo acid dehydrogenase subunit E2 [Actinomycetota bacterium]
MPKEVIMPKLGLTMEIGVIEKWLKKEGEFVNKGDVLFEVTTDKATMEVESADSGYLKKIVAPEGEEIPVTSIIAYLGDRDERIADHQDQAKSAVKDAAKVPTSTPEIKDEIIAQETRADVLTSSDSTVEQDRIITSPLAKKLAHELGVELSKLRGSGPGGRIVKEDILAAKEAMVKAQVTSPITPTAQVAKLATSPLAQIVPEHTMDTTQRAIEPGISKELKLTGIKKIVAARMRESYLDAPHIYLELSCDMSQASHLRDVANERYKDRSHITFTDMLIMATAKTLKLNPLLNATLKADSILIYDDVNIGVATSTDMGLVVPVLKDADKLSLFEISTLRHGLIERAKDGKQTLDDLSGGTFTITNLGVFGIESFRPIITPHQAAILAAGIIKITPVVDSSGNICARPVMSLSLACDHRIADGADGAKFLSDLKDMLENPAMML